MSIHAIPTTLMRNRELLDECTIVLRQAEAEIGRLKYVNRELLLALKLAGSWAARHDPMVARCIGSIVARIETADELRTALAPDAGEGEV